MSSYVLFGLENPLLDYYVGGGEDTLQKYGLNANDAILASEKQMGIYKETCISYGAGGAAQNSCRAAQYVLPPNSTVFAGCVGNDKFAHMLRESNDKAGLRSLFSVDPSTSTGVCAVVLSNNNKCRSLCTNLGAANNYKLKDLKAPEVWSLVESSKIIYVGGYHLTVSPEAMLELAKHAVEKNKPYIMNLSAPFLSQFFKEQMDSVVPYCDYIIGNESEILSYGEHHGIATKDVGQVALALASVEKVNKKRSRAVVITQGADATIVVQDGKVNTYKPNHVPSEEIVDTNGAGDAFAGGFIAALAGEHGIDYAITLGHWLGQECIKVSGTTLPLPKKQYPLP